ncbi:MAG: response regulator [Muribaculaceae bacterium]
MATITWINSLLIITIIGLIIFTFFIIKFKKKSSDSFSQDFKDISTRNQLILDNISSALLFVDANYNIVWENATKIFPEKFCTETQKHIGGEICYKMLGNNTPCADCPIPTIRKTKETITTEMPYPGGKTVERSSTPLFTDNGAFKGVLIRLNDITEQKRIINELHKAKHDAEAADNLKSAFLANMSHEIRTPLNAIVGFSQLLQSTEDQKDREQYINIINTNNDLLLSLIGNILDLAKIESGMIDLKKEHFDFVPVFDEFALSIKKRLKNPAVEFISNRPYKHCMVNLDKHRLAQIYTNYATNAIKYTPSGHIEMGFEYKDNGLLLYVKDTGIGIPDSEKDKVYKRFGKLDDFAQGSGLGLAICKAIVDAKGGEVGFESTEGVGSKFWAWIPCEAEIDELIEVTDSKSLNIINEAEQFTIDNNKSDNNLNIMKILVAEDNDSNFMLLKAILKGYEVSHALNGDEAVTMALENEYDVILMDIKMPIMNGIEATQKIREFNRTIPIIAVTANAFDTDRINALNAGCNSFITKPVKKDELLKIIGIKVNK